MLIMVGLTAYSVIVYFYITYFGNTSISYQTVILCAYIPSSRLNNLGLLFCSGTFNSWSSCRFTSDAASESEIKKYFLVSFERRQSRVKVLLNNLPWPLFCFLPLKWPPRLSIVPHFLLPSPIWNLLSLVVRNFREKKIKILNFWKRGADLTNTIQMFSFSQIELFHFSLILMVLFLCSLSRLSYGWNSIYIDKELACLMQTVKHVGTVVQKAYGGDGLTIACQVHFFFFFSNILHTFLKKHVSLYNYLGWESSGSISSSRPLPHPSSKVGKRPVCK